MTLFENRLPHDSQPNLSERNPLNDLSPGSVDDRLHDFLPLLTILEDKLKHDGELSDELLQRVSELATKVREAAPPDSFLHDQNDLQVVRYVLLQSRFLSDLFVDLDTWLEESLEKTFPDSLEITQSLFCNGMSDHTVEEAENLFSSPNLDELIDSSTVECILATVKEAHRERQQAISELIEKQPPGLSRLKISVLAKADDVYSHPLSLEFTRCLMGILGIRASLFFVSGTNPACLLGGAIGFIGAHTMLHWASQNFRRQLRDYQTDMDTNETSLDS